MATTTNLQSIHTSFTQLFGQNVNGVSIQEIEIPLVQRDYAQGRETDRIKQIREAFVADLCQALEKEKGLDLDFVFGDVEASDASNGKFFPLDGQQRLTTLFLLHCYLSWHVAATGAQSWHRFSYATRPSGRAFCQLLVNVEKCRPELNKETVSGWLKNQADYLPTWKHDPTIQSMLVVLDAFHTHFKGQTTKAQQAWSHLTDTKNPAIQFHLLPMQANGLTDKLYTKMNSRGRALTNFENFKANFEELLRKNTSITPDAVNDFSQKVDTTWTDIFWVYRSKDSLIDEEFSCYFRFLMEVLAWKSNIDFDQTADSLDDLAEKIFGESGRTGQQNLVRFIQYMMDVWQGKNIKAEFQKLFTRIPANATPNKPLLIFNFSEKFDVDMFDGCCHFYGKGEWTLAHTLLFYGVLLGLIPKIPQIDFMIRLRLLRNLIAASDYEIRAGERNNMPKLLGEAEQIMLHGNLDTVTTFNQVQVANEKAKRVFLQAHPTLRDTLHKLEDHDLLRGGLTVFDLDPTKFQNRAEQFHDLFKLPYKDICGALLAKGDYSRKKNRGSGYQVKDLGSPENAAPWRDLFKGKQEDKGCHPSKTALMGLLDDLMQPNVTLKTVVNAYLKDRSTVKDWRYYLVKYPSMRTGSSGRYVFSTKGYEACMLDRTVMRSWYRDPYLEALIKKNQLAEMDIDGQWFYGYETEERWLILRSSRLKIRSTAKGWEVDPGNLKQKNKTLFASLAPLVVPQTNGIDTKDRIELAAQFLMSFLK